MTAGLVRTGAIAAIGRNLEAPSGAEVVNVDGRTIDRGRAYRPGRDG